MNRIIFSFILLFACSSCVQIKDPEVRSIRSVELKNLSTKNLNVNGDLVFYNDNPFSLELEKADIKVMVDDLELGRILQTYNTVMPSKEEFEMPVTIDLNLEKLYEEDALGSIGRGMRIVSQRELEVFLDGFIYVGYGNAKVQVPVKREEVLEF